MKNGLHLLEEIKRHIDMVRTIGIDLDTTNSVVAFCRYIYPGLHILQPILVTITNNLNQLIGVEVGVNASKNADTKY